jgi:hypothetical protein
MRHEHATLRKKIGAIRNAFDSRPSRPAKPAQHRANADLHHFWSTDEFILIRLRRRQAGPISAFQ